MEMPLEINGYRVVAIFPCIGSRNWGAENERYLHDFTAVTVNDDATRFGIVRCNAHGVFQGIVRDAKTLPEALRIARKNVGWS